MSATRLAVVVATRDRVSLLTECLASLRAALDKTDELIVVDSASLDSVSLRTLVESRGGVYLRCDEPGASRARNLGWRAARADVVAFVDDDTRVLPGWAEAATAAFAGCSDVGFVTGRLNNPTVHVERPVATFDHDEAFVIDQSTDEPFGHGANHAVRRHGLEEVGGFDERLGAGGEFRAAEDVDLWDRLLVHGYTGRYSPAMAGWHEQWRRRRHSVGLDWAYGYGGGVRLAKMARLRPGRLRRSLRVYFWAWGARTAWGHVVQRRWFLAALTLVRMIGLAVGFGRGIVIRLDDGHLAPPRGARPPNGPPSARP